MMLLRLTKGATTITLSGDGAAILACSYVPRTPETKSTEVSARRGVAESATVILGGTAAAMLSQVRAIEALLPVDDVRQQAVNEPVYVEFRQEATGDIYRSEVFVGRVEWATSMVTAGLAGGAVEVTVLWERRWYWEDTTLRNLPLTNGNGSGATAGLSIYNHDDGATGHDNWVQIAGSDVGGVVPAGCQVQLTNAIGAARTFTKLYLALNALSDPTNFAHVIEGESRLSGGSIASDAVYYSNGQALYFGVGSGEIPSTSTFVWTLPAATLQDAAGRPFRLLVRFAGGIGTTTVFAEIRAADGASVLWRGDTVALPDLYGGLTDLGVTALPPGGYSTGYGALTLALTFTGVAQRYVDFIQLTPMDGFVALECMAPCGHGESVMYDSAERRQYVLSGSAQLPYVTASGELLLQPGKTQRLIVLEQNATGTNRGEIGDMFTVQVQYRPRRLTL
jgi:hypothetical protein